MTKTEIYGFIDSGKLHINNRKRLEEDLRAFKDCDVIVTIKRKGKRSIPQNAYYFGCIVKEIQLRFRELGNDVDCETVHEFLKQKFNPEKIITPQAELIEVGGTTTDMNKDEFSEYCNRIKEWASAVLEIYIPDPNTQTQLFGA